MNFVYGKTNSNDWRLLPSTDKKTKSSADTNAKTLDGSQNSNQDIGGLRTDSYLVFDLEGLV